MDEQKGLFTQLGQVLDRYVMERRVAAQERTSRKSPGRLRWLARQIMPNIGTLLLIAALLLTQNVWARPAVAPAAPGPSATTVNYQGRLADPSGNPLDGSYGMSFSLWDAATDGNLVWGPENHTAVLVSDGLFSVGLGSQTSGGIPTSVWDGDRYLEITVGGETLEPRELIRSVPIAGMALTALTVPDGAIGTEQIADGAVESRNFKPTFFYAEYPGPDNQVVEGCADVVELNVDFPLDATYLIFATLHARQTESNRRTAATLVDENDDRVGSLQLVSSHPVNNYDGSQSVTGVATHNFTSGTHTIRLRVCGIGTPTAVRTNSTNILAIPFVQSP